MSRWDNITERDGWLVKKAGDATKMVGKDHWRIRRWTAVVDGGPTAWWLYRNTSRYTPTGKYNDVVSTRSRTVPLKWADAIIASSVK